MVVSRSRSRWSRVRVRLPRRSPGRKPPSGSCSERYVPGTDSRARDRVGPSPRGGRRGRGDASEWRRSRGAFARRRPRSESGAGKGRKGKGRYRTRSHVSRKIPGRESNGRKRGRGRKEGRKGGGGREGRWFSGFLSDDEGSSTPPGISSDVISMVPA